MQKGLDINTLWNEIVRIENAKRDFVAPTPKLTMVLTATEMSFKTVDQMAAVPAVYQPRIQVEGNGLYNIGEIAHDQISERLGIPRKYYDRMLAEAPDLLTNNVNTWFNKKPEKRLVRTLDGRIRAFLSDKYRPLDNSLIAQAALPVFAQYGDVQIMSSALTERRLYIQAVTPRLQGEVKKGDVVYAGVIISNSEVGMGAVSIETIIYRLVCGNGAIMGDGIRRNHVGKRIGGGPNDDVQANYYQAETIEADNKAFMLKMRDTLTNHLTEVNFQEKLERIRAAAEEKVPALKIQDSVQEVTKRFDLSKGEMEAVLGNFVEGGDLSKWGLANAVTATANDVQDYDRIVELERIGGKIIDLTPDEFKTIIN